MEKPNTIVAKKDKGWEAKSIIPLPGIVEKDGAALPGEEPGKAQLEIETSKPPFKGPGIKTQARVVYKTDYGFRCSLSYGGTYAETGGDYGRPVQTDKTARCTEKKVRAYHEESLGFLDAILEDVALHYGKTVEELFEPVTEPA